MQPLSQVRVTDPSCIFCSLNVFYFTCEGWSSRTQFEETWATLLGVLVTQPITMDQEEETQQEVCTHTDIHTLFTSVVMLLVSDVALTTRTLHFTFLHKRSWNCLLY